MEFLTSVLSGGITGLLGSVLAKGIGLFEAWQRRQEKALEFEHELKLLDRQAALRQAESESALRIGEAEASARLRQASYQADDGGSSYPWVAAVLRLVRPALTLMLIGLVGLIFTATGDDAQRREILSGVVYMASSAVLWWFGDRAMTAKK